MIWLPSQRKARAAEIQAFTGKVDAKKAELLQRLQELRALNAKQGAAWVGCVECVATVRRASCGLDVGCGARWGVRGVWSCMC